MGGLNGDMEALVEQAKRMYVMAQANVEQARAAYDEAKEEAQRVERILKAAGAIESEPPKQRKSKRDTAPKNMSEETRVKVWAAIHAHEAKQQPVLPDVAGSFTIKDLEVVTDLHPSSLRNGIEILRTEGAVRAVGTVANGAPRPPMVYAQAVSAVE